MQLQRKSTRISSWHKSLSLSLCVCVCLMLPLCSRIRQNLGIVHLITIRCLSGMLDENGAHDPKTHVKYTSAVAPIFESRSTRHMSTSPIQISDRSPRHAHAPAGCALARPRPPTAHARPLAARAALPLPHLPAYIYIYSRVPRSRHPASSSRPRPAIAHP